MPRRLLRKAGIRQERPQRVEHAPLAAQSYTSDISKLSCSACLTLLLLRRDAISTRKRASYSV
jgi:hypothetical protein